MKGWPTMEMSGFTTPARAGAERAASETIVSTNRRNMKAWPPYTHEEHLPLPAFTKPPVMAA